MAVNLVYQLIKIVALYYKWLLLHSSIIIIIIIMRFISDKSP